MKELPRREFENLRIEGVGNVMSNYRDFYWRWVMPKGLVVIESPALAIKLYRMLKPDEDKWDLVGDVKSFIERETKRGKIEPHIGMGFAILSDNSLNVVRWDQYCPIVARNDLYSYRNGDFSTFRKLDIRTVGAFCLWEDKIKAHEGTAWAKYLSSARGNGSKRKYLSDFRAEGKLQ